MPLDTHQIVEMDFVILNYQFMKRIFMATFGSILLFTSANARFTSSVPVTINPLHSISVTDVAGLLTNGTLDVVNFFADNGSTWALCKVRGICGGIDIDDDCICPVEVGDCVEIPPRLDLNNAAQPFHCCVDIRFGSCTIRRVTGLVLTLNPQNVQCTANDFDDDLLCTIHGTPRILTGQLAALLNQLL